MRNCSIIMFQSYAKSYAAELIAKSNPIQSNPIQSNPIQSNIIIMLHNSHQKGS